MQLKNIYSFFLIIVLTSLTFNTYAKSSVWKVSKGDDYFYLGGTIHLLSPSDYPLPEAFITAYKDADQIIFETDLAEMKTPANQQKFLVAMLNQQGKTLSATLDKNTYQALNNFLMTRGMPIANFEQFEPWAVALTITIIEYQRLGMLPEYGVEEYFQQQASKDNKGLRSLESVDDQIGFLQTMATIEPNTMVNFTLRDLKQLPEFITTLKTSWRKGDIESFTTNSLIVQMQSEFPELYQTLISDRNNRWMTTLTQLNNNETKEFVLVGTLHLNGEQGLLQLLRTKGYEIEQL